MIISAITPDGSSSVKMLRRAHTSWSVGVAGELHADVGSSAEKAVQIALAELSAACRACQGSTRDCYDITFEVDGDFVKDASGAAAFLAFYAWDLILTFVKTESSSDPEGGWGLPYNIGVIGKLGFAGAASPSPVQAVDIEENVIRHALQQLGQGSMLFLPTDMKWDFDFNAVVRELKVSCFPVADASALVRTLLEWGARLCLGEAVVPACKRIASELERFRLIEDEIKEFESQYAEVIAAFQHWQHVQHARTHYENQLERMEEMVRKNQSTSEICKRIGEALERAKGDPIRAIPTIQKEPEGSRDAAEKIDPYTVPEESGELPQWLVRRWRSVVKLLHPDSDPTPEQETDRRTLRQKDYMALVNAVRAKDELLVRTYVFKYWPEYIRQQDADDLRTGDRIDDLGDVIECLREARRTLDDFETRVAARESEFVAQMNRIWRKQQEYGENTIRKEKEQITAHAFEDAQQVEALTKRIVDLCARERKEGEAKGDYDG